MEWHSCCSFSGPSGPGAATQTLLSPWYLWQEYVANKTKKTEELRKTVEDLDGLIQQIYRDQDLTQGEEVPSLFHQAGPQPAPLLIFRVGSQGPFVPPGRVSEDSLRPTWKWQGEVRAGLVFSPNSWVSLRHLGPVVTPSFCPLQKLPWSIL